MGFSRIYLPDLSELKEQFKQDPTGLKNRLTKADSIMGPNDSMRYADRIINDRNKSSKK